MAEFYCAVCRKYKELEFKDFTKVKPPRCLVCKERAEARINAIKQEAARFDKNTPIVNG